MNPAAKAAVEAAKAAARTRAGQKVIEQGASAIAGFVGKVGGGRLSDRQAQRRQREMAHRLARQVRGQLSEAVFLGSDVTHLVVWKDDVPLAAFPPVDGDLAGRAELAHVEAADRFDPPPPKRKRGRR